MKIDKSIILLFFVAVLILSRKQESYCCFSVKMKYIWFSKNWEIKNEEKILTWEVARTVASQVTWSCRWGLMWTDITVWKCWNNFYFPSVFILSFHLFFHLSVHIPDLPVLWFFLFLLLTFTVLYYLVAKSRQKIIWKLLGIFFFS